MLAAERRAVGHGAYEHTAATFANASAGFLHQIEHVRGRERATLADYRSSIRTDLDPRWGDKAVIAITPADVEAPRDDLMASGKLSPRTVVRDLTVATGVFKHAMRKHGVTRNPASADLVDRPTSATEASSSRSTSSSSPPSPGMPAARSTRRST